MNDYASLKAIYEYQLTEGCNGFRCTSRFCANSVSFDKSNNIDPDKLAKNHQNNPFICPYLSPLVKNPLLYQKIGSFQSFNQILHQGDLSDISGLKIVLNDLEAFQHILYSDDRLLSADDLVIDDYECDLLRQAMIRHEAELSSLQPNFHILLQKMGVYKPTETFHFIRGLIIATLFQIFMNYNTFFQGFQKFITIIMEVSNINRFVFFIQKLPKVFESFVFLCQSNLSSYIIQKSSTTLDDVVIQKISRLLQIMSTSNKVISPLCFINDLVTSLFDADVESRIWMSEKFTFIIYKNVLSCEKRVDFLNRINGFGHNLLVLNVERNKIEQDSLVLLDINSSKLKNRICVKFRGEDGIDMGGLTKEYFHLITCEITDPNNKLFYLIDDKYSWFLNNKKKDICLYKLLGIVLALSIHNKIMLPVKFPDLLYKKICGAKIQLEDLSEIKPDVVKQLEQLDDFIDEAELYFSVSTLINDKVLDIDLIEDGSNIRVNHENKEKYIELMLEWYGKKDIEAQFESFLEGFHRVIEYGIGYWFTDKELNLMISGSDVYDWKAFELATTYDGYRIDNKTIIDFWIFFNELTHANKLKLLFFITGSQVIPLGGIEKIKIKIIKTSNINMIPEAHTCTLSLVLPEYNNYDVLKRFLNICIENCQGFGFK